MFKLSDQHYAVHVPFFGDLLYQFYLQKNRN